MRILLLLDKEYNSLQCLMLHETIRPDFETITEGKIIVSSVEPLIMLQSSWSWLLEPYNYLSFLRFRWCCAWLIFSLYKSAFILFHISRFCAWNSQKLGLFDWPMTGGSSRELLNPFKNVIYLTMSNHRNCYINLLKVLQRILYILLQKRQKFLHFSGK